MKKHTISVLVENKFGVLARIAGLFSARGFNIDSLAVAETEDPTISRMTIVLRADDRLLEQVKKQLNKLIDVIKVQDFTGQESVGREIVMVRLAVPEKDRAGLMKAIESLKAEIIDAGRETVTIQKLGDSDEIDELFNAVRSYDIKEIVRSGAIAIAKEGGQKGK